MLKVMPESVHKDVIGSNSNIRYFGNRYRIFAGSINPKFEGTFDEVKSYIQQEIDLWHSEQKF